MTDLLRSLRPYQWTKNLLVFAALVFALDLRDPQKVEAAVVAFLCFCAASSATYLFNDIRDRERDRLHPEKAQRPIAAGRVSVPVAVTAAIVLVLIALLGSYTITWRLTAVIASYLVLQGAYSLGLKHVPIVDALCVSAGFLLRAVAGAEAVQVPISSWLLMCTIFLSIFISFAKRRHEFVTLPAGGESHRQSLVGYSVQVLDQLITVSAAATLISYALYTADAETVGRLGTNRLILTLPFVIYGVFRYLTLVQVNEGTGDPSLALVRDKHLLITVALWGMTVVTLLYLG
jgi:4-hydroxybenzoate polyprenyltransferase